MSVYKIDIFKCQSTSTPCMYIYIYINHKADTHAKSLCCYHQASASHAAKQADSEALPSAGKTNTCDIK